VKIYQESSELFIFQSIFGNPTAKAASPTPNVVAGGVLE